MKGKRAQSKKQPAPRIALKQREASIIGAGRLGTALGVALSNQGYDVRLVVNRHSSTAGRAAKLIGPDVVGVSVAEMRSLASPAAHLLARSSLILISTPDEMIKRTAESLADFFERQGRPTSGARTVLHTSGALSSLELQPLKKMGFATGSLHPLISVSGPASNTVGFRNSFFCVEGDAHAVRVAGSIARDLGGRSFSLAANSKPLYHAAAVMAAGNTVALLDIAVEMLKAAGLSEEKARQVLLPLVKSSIANLELMNSSDALTGPLARGDLATIRKHLEAMKTPRLRLAREVYKALSRQSLTILDAGGKSPPNLQALTRLLGRGKAS